MISGTKQIIYQHSDSDEGVTIWQQGSIRHLEFADGLVQSIIDMDNANDLVSPLSRAMLASLMMLEDPRRVLLVGAGGGAIARFLSRRGNGISGDALEISRLVADLAVQYFQFPTQLQGWRMIIQDARDYLKNCEDLYDLIIIDIAEQSLTPAWVVDESNLLSLKNLLSPSGCLVTNLMFEDADSLIRLLLSIRQVFMQKTACLSVPEFSNVVVFACNQGVDPTSFRLAQKLDGLERHWGLEFRTFWQRMQQENPPGSGLL